MTKHQKDLINALLKEDEFILIVLDACRYDYMKQWADENEYDLNVQKIKSGVPNTHTWIRTRWDGEYDLVYVSSIPYVANQNVEGPNGGTRYNGSEHFSKVVEGWRHYWDDELRCLTPSACVDATKDNMDDRMVVHFGQPHMPHIGDPPMINKEIKSDNLSQVGSSGEFSDEYIHKSYYGNLKKAMEEGVKQLVSLEGDNDKRVVITADHGESLGEDGNYGHNNHSDEVEYVPWVEV